MPVVGERLAEHVLDARARAQDRGGGDPEARGERVGGLEADAADVARQAVGILLDQRDRVGAVGLVDADRARGADAVRVQEHHDLAHAPLLLPGFDDALAAHVADARHFAQAPRAALDHVEHVLAEGRHQPLREFGPMPRMSPDAR